MSVQIDPTIRSNGFGDLTVFFLFFQKKGSYPLLYLCKQCSLDPTQSYWKFGSLPNILQLKPPKEGRSKQKQASRDRSQSITILQQEKKKYNISEIKDNSAISNNIYRQLCYCRNAFHSSFYMYSCLKFVTSIYLGFFALSTEYHEKIGGWLVSSK